MDTLGKSDDAAVGDLINKYNTMDEPGIKIHNGFEVDHSKSNGNCSDMLNSSSPDKSGLLDKSGNETLHTVDTKNQNGDEHKEQPDDISTNVQKHEEDLDNSTATSNISDISPYEDSEKSMDIEVKTYLNTENKVSEMVENSRLNQGGTDLIENYHSKHDETEPVKNFGSKHDETKLKETEESEKSQEIDSENNCQELQDTAIDMHKLHTSDNKTPEISGIQKENVESDSQNKSKELSSLNNETEMDTSCEEMTKNLEVEKEETMKTLERKENVSDENNKVIQKENLEAETNSSEKIDIEVKSNITSVEKVTDIDGSEILITLNEENEESDHEDEEASEKQKQKDNNNENTKHSDNVEKKASQEVVVVNESPEKKMNSTTSVVTIKSETTVVNSKPTVNVQPSVAAVGTTHPVRLPVLPGAPVQYFVSSSIQSIPNQQQKYINVGGQQILIQVPVSSINTPGTINSQVNLPTFPPPNLNKKPLDKTIDLDIPQASWEQKEIIKYEVQQKKPDNAFWGGLANVSKKADLSNVAKFLFDLGSDIVKESAYEQIVQVQKKKEDSNLLNGSEKESLQRMQKVVEELKEKLKYLHDLPTLKCKCGFTTDSANVMFLHRQYPHTSDNALTCAHCEESFDGKSADERFRIHMEIVHKIKPMIYAKTSYWPCNLCAFDATSKSALARHKFKCMKNFKQHLNQAPHHVDINLSLKNIFYKFQVNNRKLQQSQVAAVERPDTRGNKVPPIAQKQSIIQPRPGLPVHPIIVNPNRTIIPPHFQPSVSGVSPANTWQNNYNRILASPANFPINGPRFAQVQRPPPPLKPSTVNNKPTVNQLLKSHQPMTNPSTNRTGFEVCEICGGYVKDRMSLRIHFFYAHKIEMPAHVFNKPLAPLFCSTCSERFWTSQGFAKHKTSTKHIQKLKAVESVTNQCWICHQKPENLYSHLHKFHRLTTGECMALKRCMFCGILAITRKELELHMAGSHGVLIKGDEGKTNMPVTNQPSSGLKPVAPSNVNTKNLSTVVTGGSSGMVRNNFCVFCSAQFPDNTKLTLHCLSVHATCKKCGMVVNKSADLTRHVCKMSSKTCNICGMKNLKPAGLLKHFETHTKPCKVALKRLSPSQIEKATGQKHQRLDTRAGRRNLSSGHDISHKKSSSDRNRSSLTVAMNFDKPKHRGKVVIDLSQKLEKDEVVIESDNDSDVIIQEEEKTEIVLDSDDDEKTKSRNVNNDISENVKLVEMEKTETEKTVEPSENMKNTEKESEEEKKMDKLGSESSKNKVDTESSQILTEKIVENEQSENKEANHDLNTEITQSEKLVETVSIKEGRINTDCNLETKTNNLKESENSEIQHYDVDENAKISDTDSQKSRKRSRSDEDNSDEESSKKKIKSDDESDN